MDIEGSEVELLREEPIENLKKVRQLAMELHGISVEDIDKFLAVARKMKDAGFVISHVHGNNCCGVVHVGEFAVPSTLEMTYVMAPAGGCASDLPIRIPLDKPNIDWRDEIEDPVLPAADGASLVAKRS